MKGGFGNLLKQAQVMQENLKKAEQELADVEVTGDAGGGMIKVTMSCAHEVRRIEIDPVLLSDDKEVLEDLIAAATNDALRKAESTRQEKMSGFTAGLNIPGLKLPF